MPVKFGLWRVDGTQIQQVPAAIVASEERLEEIIEARIDILGLGTLFQIGRQVITDYGKRIDILAIDAQGLAERPVLAHPVPLSEVLLQRR
jgi:hypothetical protein